MRVEHRQQPSHSSFEELQSTYYIMSGSNSIKKVAVVGVSHAAYIHLCKR